MSSSRILHQHLAVVAADSSGGHHLSMNTVHSPTSDTSPSLRAPSTDQDFDRYRSSPSTSYTSASTSTCDSDDGEQEGQGGECEGISSSNTKTTRQVHMNVGPVPSRSWKMPFAKSSAPPRALSTAFANAQLSSNNRSPPRRNAGSNSNKQSTSPSKLSFKKQETDNEDGSFVETTSEKAAQALANYWNHVQAQSDVNGRGMSKVATSTTTGAANDYVVVARVENGKRIYKIRPRSRPTAALQEGHVHRQPQSSNKLQPLAPSSTASSSSKTNLQMPPSIRLTKSIPNLRTRSNSADEDGGLLSISRDKDGFYRPSGSSTQPDNAYLTLPLTSAHHVLRNDDDDTTPHHSRKSTLQTASSIPNLRAHRDQDVFGKLLGWQSEDCPPQYATISTSSPTKRQQTGKKGSISPPPTRSPERLQHEKNSPVKSTYEDVHTPINEGFPYQLAPSLQEATRVSIDSHRDMPAPSTSSPFGHGVRLPSQPRLKRKKSIQQLHGTIMVPQPVAPNEESGNNTFDSYDSFDTSVKIRSLREVGSSETIRTAKAVQITTPIIEKREQGMEANTEDQPYSATQQQFPESPRTPMAITSQRDAWLSDTRIYDDLQVVHDESQTRSPELRDSLKPTSEGAGRRHERGMSNTSLVSLGGSSLHSTDSAASAGEQAHTITVTNMPGDDRRFVIWGRRPGPPAARAATRPASNARMSPASLSSSGAHSSLGSSKRSSFQRKHDSSATELSTPPTSASSPSSPWSTAGSSPPVQKVLLAATVDRWIAQMTSEIENDLMTDFFFTYRSFLSPLALCKLLITRFEWALQPGHGAKDAATRRIVRVRTYVVIRHWILNYFHEDFVPDRELRTFLTSWLNRMGKDERLRPNPTDLRLIKSLKKVVKRLKAAYSTIGIDQATDANTLIKTSLEEADAHYNSRTRGRSDSMASMSSLQSIREEQSEMALPVRAASQEGFRNSAESASVNSEAPATHIQRKDIRTSSSEDDVDLEIEMHVSGYEPDELPRIPPFIPISPPRVRHQSPLHQRKSRSPQLGSYERNSMALDGMPVIADNHRVSRAIASTVGSFSKLRRMMGTRRTQATSNAPKYYNDATSNMSQFGALAPNDEPEGLFRTSTMLSRSVSGHSGEEKTSGLGIYNEETSSPASSSTTSATPSTQDLRHSASNGTMRRKPSRPNLLRLATSSSSDGASGGKQTQKQGSPSPVKARLAPAANIRMSGIQLDDCDSSGDESNVGDQPPLRTLRRLPAARDLRGGKGPAFNSLAHRHSIDSIASYATRRLPSCALEPIRIPSIATYDSNSSSAHDADRDALATQGMIPFFVLPNDSEDEDEPGDVEAALRRLEGQIDTEKQRSNAQKVERYLKRSAEAKANGGYIYGENDEQSDEDDLPSSRPESAAISYASETNPDPDTIQEEQQPAALEMSLRTSEGHPQPVPRDTMQAENLAVPNAITANGPGTRTIQRKSSMRRFFGSTLSVSLWPSSNASSRSTKSKIFQPPAYRSFLFGHKIEALARHFCIIERDLLEKVTWQELISSTWRERLDIEEVMDWDSFMKIRAKLNSEAQEHQFFTGSALTQPKRVGDVQTIIHRFNLMCRWIASEIVLTTSTAERALLLTKIIKLALKSYYIYNFQTVTQIMHALQLPSIERLKKTWSKVPSFEMKLFDKLKLFCSPLRDFRLLREATGALALQWGPPGQEERELDMQGIPGALPFFGLILRDLAISKELPTFLDPSNPRAPADIDEDSMLLPEYTDPSEFFDLPPLPEGLPLRPLINIHKYRTIAKTIQLVMTFKELAGTYPYEPELPLYRKCLTIQCLPMDKIVELSTACEK